MIEAVEALFVLLIAFMLAYLVRHNIFTFTVLRRANNPKKTEKAHAKSNFEPSVTILIPARNEENVIGRLLQRLTELTYPKNKLQVIVINDASDDQTGKIVSDFHRKYPYIEVINRDKIRGGKGKSAAMNHGFSKSNGEIILCFDADYYPQQDIVERLTSPFVDPTVGGVQGRVVVLNEPQNIITRLIALERVGGYRVDQEARDNLGLIVQFGGTVGGFRRRVLETLHGWDETMLSEDTDLTLRTYLAGYKIKYEVNAECYEEAVDNWRAYWRQRYRWAKGHMQCFFKHSWKVLTTNKLNLKQKVDGLLLLSVYFMPTIVFLSFVLGLILLMQLPAHGFGLAFMTLVPVSCYSFIGNFAPFFEVGVGLYLDGRKRSQWLLPLSILTFLFNLSICGLALLDVLAGKIRRKRTHSWSKTNHSGKGDNYVNGLTLKVKTN
ncbi:MAG: glycosyltransferase family 2 protein [Candidatus Bathyarchaeota archaeon]|nr:glycosyltransferase family 2 protein [Candidatus Bathyarchaeota archaeon]